MIQEGDDDRAWKEKTDEARAVLRGEARKEGRGWNKADEGAR